MGLASRSGIFPAVCSGAARGLFFVAAETHTNLKNKSETLTCCQRYEGALWEGLYLPLGLLFWEDRWLHRHGWLFIRVISKGTQK